MVMNISKAGLVMLFVKGFSEPLCGWIKGFEPTTLRVAINKTRDMQDVTSKNKFIIYLISFKRVKRTNLLRRSWSGNQIQMSWPRRIWERRSYVLVVMNLGHQGTGVQVRTRRERLTILRVTMMMEMKSWCRIGTGKNTSDNWGWDFTCRGKSPYYCIHVRIPWVSYLQSQRGYARTQGNGIDR